MNILVIGNGFDLAHGLPTKYTDFLEFCKIISRIYISETLDEHIYKVMYLESSNLNEEIKQQLLDVFTSRKVFSDIDDNGDDIYIITTDYPKSDELYALIKDNFWTEYFLQCDMHGDENWIDFESEVSGVIQSLDDDMHGLSQVYNIEDIVYDLSNGFLKEKYSDYITVVPPKNPVDNGLSNRITFKEIRNKLLDDLNKLIRALEIYLCEYVEKIEIEKKSLYIDTLDIDFILSFNYTHIFSKLYNVSNRSKQEVVDPFDYIHGKTDISNTVETNNMVLGIDEYLLDDRKNKDIEFIAFKKFYQRIYKETGSKYKTWLDVIKKNGRELKEKYKKEYPDQVPFNQYGDKIHRLYIFGHSLDITDKDILRELILNDNVYTTIFYHSKDTMGQQIANLVKVIGQDELIRRTGGNTKTIEFKLQQDMIPAIN